MKKELFLATVLTVSGVSIATDASAKVKCHGVAEAGKNDCHANGHSCGGYAKTDYDPKEWKFVDSQEECDKLKAVVKSKAKK